MNKSKKKIAVIGLGYVGLPLALLADQKGCEVIGIDKDEKKVELINKRTLPFEDKENAELLKKSQIKASTDFSNIKDSEIIIICVPTPVHQNHMPNLSPVKNACTEIGKRLQKGQLVILESTVNPGVSENIVKLILEEESGLKLGKDFYLAHCPERINPGDPKWNVSNINRVVGAYCKTGLDKALKFYESLIDAEIKPMNSLKEAEAVKVVENSFRDINIAFVNELAMSFEKLGIDVVNVIEGAATKPFSFMPHFPGCGVGGHCIPVDPYYLIEYAKKNGFNHDFLSNARRINSGMPEYTTNLLMKGLNQIETAMKGTKVAVLGLAYKADIDDCRESPSFEIIKHLKNHGAEVIAYDPFVPAHSDVKTLTEALEQADAVVIATNHTEFKDTKPQLYLDHDIKVVIDGKNCLDKSAFTKSGIIYRGVGR